MEVLANVASFVAGANDYGTLAAFSSTSQLMQRELSSILHETVIWNDFLQERLKDCKAQGGYPDHFMYIRCVPSSFNVHEVVADTIFPFRPSLPSFVQVYHCRSTAVATTRTCRR